MFILPSLWEDPGFVLIEAASTAVPIISSDCEWPTGILSNGNGGFLFESNNESFINTFVKCKIYQKMIYI